MQKKDANKAVEDDKNQKPGEIFLPSDNKNDKGKQRGNTKGPAKSGQRRLNKEMTASE